MVFTEKDKNKLFSELRKLRDQVVNCSQQQSQNTEFDHTLLCAPGNILVIAVIGYSGTGDPTVNYYNLNGTLYVGPQPNRCSDTLESDPQIICVQNTTELIQWVVKDNGQPTGTVYYTDLSGAIVPAPGAGTFTFGSCSQTNDQVFQRCRCDDVNGDGSLIVKYIEFYIYDPATNTVTITGTWTEDLSATYTPISPTSCSSIGTLGTLRQGRMEFSGIFAWAKSPARMFTSITIKTRRTSLMPGALTVTDHLGTVTNLYAGDVDTWTAQGTGPDSAGILDGLFSISSTHADNIITIIYTEII